MKNIFWIMAGVVFAMTLVALGWILGRHHDSDYNPYQVIKGYEGSRHAFLVKSAEVSVKMTDLAIEALKNKDIKKAVEDCKTAIDIFPIDAKPYILLTKLYLMTGQERNMYDVLTLAGNSYPNFDNIVAIIDDENLDKIPLEVPQDNVYLANFSEDKSTAISFMFDDGEANVYHALPTFEKYGYRATIPVVAAFVADKSNDPFWGSWAEWRDAASRGFEIANHSMFHRNSKDLHGSDFDVAIDQARDVIAKNTGASVTSYVFPHDSYTDEAVQRALMTHKAIRTPAFLHAIYNREVDVVIGGPHVSVETGERLVDIGIKRNLWLIAKCHGVTDRKTMRSFKSITPEFLESYLNYIHSKSDQVWVDTFYHVFEYMSERAHTTIDTKSFTDHSMDFILHSDQNQATMARPLTVIVKMPAGVKIESAQSSGGHRLKAWACAQDKVCVDVDAYDENIHLQWSHP